MAYSDPQMQLDLVKAKNRALNLLKARHPDEWEEMYSLEMLALGYERIPRGKKARGGWRRKEQASAGDR